MRQFDSMKRKRSGALALFFVLLLSVMIPCGIYATETTENATYIFDEAGLFTEEQRRNLEEDAKALSDYAQCGVYFMSVDDYWNYSTEIDVLTAAEDIYLTNGFGIGDEQNGIFLLLSMDYREYALVTYGDFAHMAFTDYGQEMLCEQFLYEFRHDDWYYGVCEYIRYTDVLLDKALSGNPLDVPGATGNRPGAYEEPVSEGTFVIALIMAFVPAAALAMLICVVLKRQMKTARKRTDAFEYIVDNSVNFRIQQDRFTHVTHSRRRVSNSNGGVKVGGTTVRSSGFSGRSGKF